MLFPSIIGRSVLGAAIEAWSLGDGPDATLYLGAHHGSEIHGPHMIRCLMEVLADAPSLLAGRRACFVPVLNPDGLAAGTRHNAHGVDLNRNLPTRDWTSEPVEEHYTPGPAPASEPETRALVGLVEAFQPDKIVTIHAPMGCVNWNGLSLEEAASLPEAAPRRVCWEGKAVVCAEALGAEMSRLNGYASVGDIGYPCPGSFGTWAGHERRIATITLEIGPDTEPEAAWQANREALLAALAF